MTRYFTLYYRMGENLVQHFDCTQKTGFLIQYFINKVELFIFHARYAEFLRYEHILEMTNSLVLFI